MDGHKTAKKGRLRIILHQGMIKNLQYVKVLFSVGMLENHIKLIQAKQCIPTDGILIKNIFN